MEINVCCTCSETDTSTQHETVFYSKVVMRLGWWSNKVDSSVSAISLLPLPMFKMYFTIFGKSGRWGDDCGGGGLATCLTYDHNRHMHNSQYHLHAK